MAKSSISCSDDQRWEIVQIKREIKAVTGIEPKDRELVDIFLRLYKENKPLILGDILNKAAKKLQETILMLEDLEKLKEEVEELRKENERLREQLKNQTVVNNSREAYKLFCRLVLEEAREQKLSQKTIDKLIEVTSEVFKIYNTDGTLNWEKILELREMIL